MSVTARLSVEEYLTRDFPPSTQLIDGEVVMNQPVLRDQRFAFYLARRLADWVDAGAGRGEAGIGMADWTVGDRDVFVPDAWWVRPERGLARDAPRGYQFPDLVVEVRSPFTWRYDLGRKRDMYEQHGVLELWLIDGDAERVIVDRRSHSASPTFDVRLEVRPGDTLTSPLLPGLEIAVGELFDR